VAESKALNDFANNHTLFPSVWRITMISLSYRKTRWAILPPIWWYKWSV